MSIFGKLKHAKSFLSKGAAGVENFSSKLGKGLHTVNHIADKIANSKAGGALLDATGTRGIYTVARGVSGSLEAGSKAVGGIAHGVHNVANAQSLNSAIKHSNRMYKDSSRAIGDGERAVDRHRGELEKARPRIGAPDTGGRVRRRKKKNRS